MFRVRSGFRRNQFWIFVLVTLVFPGALAYGQSLSLEQAEALAVDRDPAVAAVRSRKSALDELQVAASQLPDPMLKFGVMSLPTDSWQLGQEPMTQLQVGVIQRFPRGDSRELRAQQLQERARALDEVAGDKQLLVRMAVRENYLEVLKHQRLGEINAEAEAVFSDLAEITQDYYATGQVAQQDVLRAAVELAKIKERSARISEEQERARGRLAAWIGDEAWRELDNEWPEFERPPGIQAIKDGLPDHPRIRGLHQEVIAADKGVDLARQNYKPEFALDLTYGGRGGNNMDGSSRADLFSVMVMMDIPLFADKRQDRTLQATMALSSAAAFDRDDMYRKLVSEVDVNFSSWQRQRERLALYENSLLPDAEFNAQSSFDAYQVALTDMTTLMRARITEYDLQLEYAGLRAESYKSRVRLLYLEGK